MTRTYRGWTVSNDRPPIPTRDYDWSATSPDYDTDCAQGGFFQCAGTIVYAPTYEQLTQEIDWAIEGQSS